MPRRLRLAQRRWCTNWQTKYYIKLFFFFFNIYWNSIIYSVHHNVYRVVFGFGFTILYDITFCIIINNYIMLHVSSWIIRSESRWQADIILKICILVIFELVLGTRKILCKKKLIFLFVELCFIRIFYTYYYVFF